MSEQEQHTTVLVDRLFRQSSGKMVAILSHKLGLEHLAMVEDIVQEAFMQALQSWKLNGYPQEPEAWLMRTARNRAIDRLRQRKLHHSHLQRLTAEHGFSEEAFFHEQEVTDSHLRMIFACCHPSLNREDQVGLTLKAVFGFSTAEIGKALLSKEATIQKRLVRARNGLREQAVQLEIPAGHELTLRLDTALSVLYLLFNEGYYAPGKEEDIRYELCVEAMQCCKLLVEHPITSSAACHALLALMCLHAARFNSRSTNNDSIVLLQEQDRSLWDQDLIKVGYHHLNKASTGSIVGQYQVEAAIAAEYTMANNFEHTNWKRLLQHYTLLLQINPSPHVLLSRAFVLSRNGQTELAIASVLEIPGIDLLLQTNHLYSAVLAQLYLELSNKVKAGEYLQRAYSLSPTDMERKLFEQRLAQLHKN